jgi:hypothetical protein
VIEIDDRNNHVKTIKKCDLHRNLQVKCFWKESANIIESMVIEESRIL